MMQHMPLYHERPQDESLVQQAKMWLPMFSDWCMYWLPVIILFLQDGAPLDNISTGESISNMPQSTLGLALGHTTTPAQ